MSPFKVVPGWVFLRDPEKNTQRRGGRGIEMMCLREKEKPYNLKWRADPHSVTERALNMSWIHE